MKLFLINKLFNDFYFTAFEFIEFAINSYANISAKSSGTLKLKANSGAGLFTLQYKHYAKISENDYTCSNLTIMKKGILFNVREKDKIAQIKQVLNPFESLIDLKLAFPMQMFKLSGEDNSNDVDAAILQCFDLLAYYNLASHKHRPGEKLISIACKTQPIDCRK